MAPARFCQCENRYMVKPDLCVSGVMLKVTELPESRKKERSNGVVCKYPIPLTVRVTGILFGRPEVVNFIRY